MKTIHARCEQFLAIVARDLLSAMRYPMALPLYAASILPEIALFYFLARAIGPGFQPDGFAFFPFLLVGSSIYGSFFGALTTFVNGVREAQMTGAMEILMLSRCPAPALFSFSACSKLLGQVAYVILYLTLGLLLFAGRIGSPNLLAGGIIMALAVVITVAFGLMAAALQIATQRAAAALSLVGSIVWLLSGTLVPVSSLPGSLQVIAKLLPLTYVLEGLRSALLQGASVGSLSQTLFILALFAGALLPLGFWILAQTLRSARLKGALSYY